MCDGAQVSLKVVGSLGAGITGSSKSPDRSFEKKIGVIFKRNKCS